MSDPSPPPDAEHEPYVFLSYAHADADYVYPEARALIDRGFQVWFDERIRAGTPWRDEIAEAIEHASAVLLFVSPRSIGSEHCQKEIHHALLHRRPVLSVHLEHTRMSGGLAFAIGNEQALHRHELESDDYAIRLSGWLRQHLQPGERGGRAGGEPVSRRVAIMVSDLVLADTAPSPVHELKIAFSEFCARQMTDFGGLAIDALDGRTVSVFGFPDSFEDNASHAALAALHLHEAFAGFVRRMKRLTDAEFDLAIVLHSDQAVADGITQTTVTGPGLRAVMRAALNLDEGGLYVTARSAERFCRGGHFADLPSPVPGLRILKPDIDARRNQGIAAIHDPDFVGREQELIELTRLVHRAERGEGGAVFVTGEAGIGKSRLARALRESLDDAFTWVQISAAANHSTDSLHAFDEAMRRAWYIRPGDDEATRMAKALAATSRLGMDVRDVRGPLSDLLEVSRARTDATRSSEQRRDEVLTFILEWFEALTANATTVLLVEDMHWLDPSSSELVCELARVAAGTRLLLLITSREEPPDELRDLPSLLHFSLRPLDEAEARSMLSQHLPDFARIDSVIDQIVARAGGLPLFLDELARMAASAGDLEAIPATLQDLLASRLDALREGRSIAQWAAVLGRQFSYDVLASVAGLDGEALDSALAEMMAEQILYRRGIGRRRTFLFRHALLRDTAYQMIPEQTRTRLHATVAEALLAAPDAARNAHLAAVHLRAAGKSQEAAEQFHTAAKRALERSAYHEARQNLRAAIESLDAAAVAAPEQRFIMHVDRFVATSAIAGYTSGEAQAVLEDARLVSRDMGDAATAASFMQKLCFLYVQRGELETALTFARQIEDLEDRPQPDPRARARLVEALGATSLLAGFPARARVYLTEAVDLADRLGDTQDLIDTGVFCRAFLSTAIAMDGQFSQARRMLDAAIERARALGDPFALACAFDAATKLHVLTGDPSGARDAAVELIVQSSEANLEFFAGMGHVIRGWARAAEGEVASGREEIVEGLAILDRSKSGRERTLHLGMLAEVHLKAGNHVAAADVLATARHIAERTGERFNLPQLLRLEAELTESDERFDALIGDAVTLARSQNSPIFELRALTHACARRPTAAVKRRIEEILAHANEEPDAADMVAARRSLHRLPAPA